MIFRDIVLVAIGGALGAVARYLASLGCARLLGDQFPWGTLFVNVVGCFLLGWLVRTASISGSVSDSTKLILGTGLLGAFTTFSTFGVQTIQLWARSPIAALGNVTSNLLIGIAAAVAGMYFAGQSPTT